jgi:preprotein translocase subunit SecG
MYRAALHWLGIPMQTVIIVIHLMVVIALIGVVLLQRSDGGALGIGGGGGFMTGRGQANALTRATAILAALFFLTSLTLTILANINRAPKSIFEGAVPAGQNSAPAQPGQPPSGQTNSGTLLDQLQQLEQQRQQSQPVAPAPPPVPEPPQSH